MKTFVLFGSTGDLATRYVLPALGKLLEKGVYDHLICVGRRDWSRDDFRNFLAAYPDLLNHTETISYVRIDVDSTDYTPLKTQIESIGALDGEILYHLCLSPEHFAPVAKGIASVGLNTSQSILMIEKPFGHDLATAILLNLELQKYFDEHQIYRVDHYLGKTFVRELFDYRLSQGENWYNKRISSIFITAREILTIGDRGVYYDKNGATRDFLQNHLMQMLAIITMKMPCCLERADDIRDNIFYALSSVAPLLLDPRHDILLGQYIGYRETPGVKSESRTETYIKVHLTMDHPSWLGTDIILETGKALDRKESSVHIVYQDGTERIFSETSANKNNAYETLIEHALLHDETYFVRWDSVRAAWQVVNDLLHCTDNCPILKMYPIGSREV
ncbi:MAG: hypothetical protein WC753_00515 [Candidatus Gracilibacteria bacterium]